MSIQALPSSNSTESERTLFSTLPLNVMTKIFSYTGPCALSRTCKELHLACHDPMALQGIKLAAKVDPILWNANAYLREKKGDKIQRAVHPLPLPPGERTEQQAVEILKVALDTVRRAFEQFPLSAQEKFEGCTPQQCCVNPRRMNEILHILDEIALFEIVKDSVVDTSLPQQLIFKDLQYIYHTRDESLRSLPISIGKVAKLHMLFLGGCRLRALPASIENLAHLAQLILTDNQLGSFPDSIVLLKNLQDLWLSDNFLTSLPESIGLLTELRGLFVDHNKLISLPKSLTKLTKLTLLTIHGNKKLGDDEGSCRILATLEERGCTTLCDAEVREAIQNLPARTER